MENTNNLLEILEKIKNDIEEIKSLLKELLNGPKWNHSRNDW